MEVAEASAPEDEIAAEEAAAQRGGFGSLGSIIFLLVLTWAAGIASFPLNDNSFFTHLATGRLILEKGSVPSTDPYTFTASGEPWTVQSWLASVAYAGFERLAGEVGLRLLVLGVYLLAAAVLWRLSRPAPSLVVRLLIVSLALFTASGLWAERPFMVGVVGLGLVWLALEGAFRPWLLVPVIWVWGNAHGSFFFATALVVAVLAGAALDRRAAGGAQLVSDHERKVLGATVLGTLLVAVSPVGPRLLIFPLVAARRSDVFGQVVEWQAPGFRRPAELAYLVLVLLTVLLLVRAATWRLALPATMFFGASLYAQRNIVLATVVLVAVAAACSPGLGTLRAADRPRLGRPMAVVVSVLAVLTAASTLVSPAAALDDYPSAAHAWLAEQPWMSGRLAAEVSTGNMVEVLDGARGAVFVDDRFDLLPDDVFDDYVELKDGGSGWQRILDEREIDVVLWSGDAPLASLLELSPSWRVAYSDPTWIVACRRSVCSSA